MRMGLELLLCSVNPERFEIAKHSLDTLSKTNIKNLQTPLLYITFSDKGFDFTEYFEKLGKKFDVIIVPDPDGFHGTSQLYVNAGYEMINRFDFLTHLFFMWDDFIYNSEWLQQLTKLIERHPDGIAWSVYRSRYTRHHRIIGGDGTDVLMSMHDGVGAVTREEWLEYKKYNNGYDFQVPADWPGGGNTPDIHHSCARPGNRWATSRDYLQNLGRHVGIEAYDCAIDFVGE